MTQILAVVSMPPPITGQATAARMLIEALDDAGVDHVVFDTASPVDSAGVVPALRSVGRTLANVARLATTKHAGRDTIAYFQLGQGPSSILRDLPMLTVAAARRWRIIGHLHGGGWRTGLDQVPAPLRRLYLRVLERSDTIVILAPRLAVMFDGLGLSDRLRVIGNGVERHLALAAVEHPSRWSDRPTVVFLSNLMPEKGIDTFLDAARLAVEEQPALRFVVAGGADAPVDTSSWPANVVYRGVVHGADKESLLAEAQLLALPTRYWVEGEPISILEAFHFGLPVVSCDQGGIADLVGPDNGAIVPANDPVALLGAIVINTIDRERWEQVSDANRRQARSEHSLDAHLAAMFDLFGVSA
ncbi:MAG: glycosyltransferase family 4 protein [Acidimicrobiales bacterium]